MAHEGGDNEEDKGDNNGHKRAQTSKQTGSHICTTPAGAAAAAAAEIAAAAPAAAPAPAPAAGVFGATERAINK